MQKSTTIARLAKRELLAAASSYPIVTILGPRQSGKTTLAKQVFAKKSYVNLEDPDIRAFVIKHPRQFLKKYPDGCIIDEVQRAPQLLSYLQMLVDDNDTPGQFILTGSDQLTLQSKVAQSLVGRTGFMNPSTLSLKDLAASGICKNIDEQIFLGFYPRIYKHNMDPQRFYRDYLQTYIEKDLRILTNIKDLDAFQKFLSLCATRVGQVIDFNLISNDLGISSSVVKEWISMLKASYLVTTVSPYFTNLGKRLVKTPKLYFNDTGLICYLLGISSWEQLQNHPLRGSIFENLIINEVTKSLWSMGVNPKLYFYRDNDQLEIDLLFQHHSQLFAMEIKSCKKFDKSCLKNLKRFSFLAGSPLVHNGGVKPALVYGGSDEERVGDIDVVSYSKIAEFLAK